MTPRQRKSFVDFVRQLVSAATALSLYSTRHPTTVERSTRALALLREALADGATLTILFVNNELFLDGTPLEKEPSVEQFVRQAGRYHIGHIAFASGADEGDLDLLLRIIARQAPPELRGTPHLTFGSVEVDSSRHGSGEAYFSIPSYSSVPTRLLQRVANAYAPQAQQDAIDLDALVSLVGGFVSAFRSEANPLLALVPLREMDEHSFHQALNVCVLNVAQGVSLAIEGQLLHDLGVAALLHDTGKARVAGSDHPEDPEFLTQHTVRGAEYLLSTPGVPRIAVATAFEHHLRYDLTGFPKVPPGWQLNLCSHLTMISACFDALRTRELYRGPEDFEQTAGELLRRAGTELHPALTLNFVRVLRKMETGRQLEAVG